MGIINPRPAMRHAEERKIRSLMEKHQTIYLEIHKAGVEKREASRIAYDIVSTAYARKQAWKRKAQDAYEVLVGVEAFYVMANTEDGRYWTPVSSYPTLEEALRDCSSRNRLAAKR